MPTDLARVGSWPEPEPRPTPLRQTAVREDVGSDARWNAVLPASVSASRPAAAASLYTVGLWQLMAPIFQKCLNVYSRLPPQRALQLSASCALSFISRTTSPCQLNARVPWPCPHPPSSTQLRWPQPGDGLCNLQERGRSNQTFRRLPGVGLACPSGGKASNCSSMCGKFGLVTFSSNA